MGNGYGKIKGCFNGGAAAATSPSRQHHRHDIAVMMADQVLDEGLGHSFCYVRPTCTATATSDDGHSHNHNQSSVRLRVMQSSATASSKVHSDDAKRLESSSSSAQGTTTFRSISGASVSANTSTALTAAMPEQYNTFVHRTSSSDCAAAFESTDSFTAMPLQPVPRTTSLSGPLSGAAGFFSGPLEQAQLRGFLSGPLERAYMSGPLDPCYKSGPIDVIDRSLSSGLRFRRRRRHSQSISRLLRSAGGPLRRALSGTHRVLSTVVQQQSSSMEFSSTSSGGTDLSAAVDDSTSDSNPSSQNLQWAQGKAGEDRVHVVVSDDYGWLFVGIYDGFNGPDAPDYLLSNLYRSVHKELGGLMSCAAPPSPDRHRGGFGRTRAARNWKPEWKRERVEVDKMLGRDCCYREAVDHGDVLNALSRALSKTEEAFLDMADKAVAENPELALMGSCVLVMLMMGEDVYVMNVGDSRAVLAQQVKPGSETVGDSLQRISEETAHNMEAANFDDNDLDADRSVKRRSLGTVQLTRDHSTSVDEEVKRIEGAHLDDVLSIVNDRVKGSLKVTRAFGAGYLKQPKWNDALLEVFRIDYVGTAPYITCTPDLRHHRLGPEDHFLILSSDGLYQYFTNEEVVNEVEWFMDSFPDGDPAQHLVEEVLFRAAKKAGMDFHELLEIPQGDRRKYHDDVSVMVVSLEGRIWRSSV